MCYMFHIQNIIRLTICLESKYRLGYFNCRDSKSDKYTFNPDEDDFPYSTTYVPQIISMVLYYL